MPNDSNILLVRKQGSKRYSSDFSYSYNTNKLTIFPMPNNTYNENFITKIHEPAPVIRLKNDANIIQPFSHTSKTMALSPQKPKTASQNRTHANFNQEIKNELYKKEFKVLPDGTTYYNKRKTDLFMLSFTPDPPEEPEKNPNSNIEIKQNTDNSLNSRNTGKNETSENICYNKVPIPTGTSIRFMNPKIFQNNNTEIMNKSYINYREGPRFYKRFKKLNSISKSKEKDEQIDKITNCKIIAEKFIEMTHINCIKNPPKMQTISSENMPNPNEISYCAYTKLKKYISQKNNESCAESNIKQISLYHHNKEKHNKKINIENLCENFDLTDSKNLAFCNKFIQKESESNEKRRKDNIKLEISAINPNPLFTQKHQEFYEKFNKNISSENKHKNRKTPTARFNSPFKNYIDSSKNRKRLKTQENLKKINAKNIFITKNEEKYEIDENYENKDKFIIGNCELPLDFSNRSIFFKICQNIKILGKIKIFLKKLLRK